jgi:UDP-glucose 4-epimerase
MPTRKRRVLVTGVSRWWGALLVQRLVEEPSVAEVIGIDQAEPRYDLGRADFLKVDIRHGLVGKLVRAVGIDTVVHTATTIDSFDLDSRSAHETNVIGTMNLLAACAGVGSPVRRLVLKSSTHVYGSRHNLPAGLREERRLDADSPHPFVRDLVELEASAHEFGLRNPEVEVLALRFANSLNAEEPQPLARYLDLELVPTFMGFDPPLQLIHRDDCAEALRLATLGGPPGAYNVGAEHPRPLSRLLDDNGKLHAPLLPPFGAGLAAAALRAAGIAFLSPQLVDLLRFGRTVSTARAARELRFKARRDTPAAFTAFLEERRVLPFLPDRGAYLYERELEDFIHARRPEVGPEPGLAPDGARARGQTAPRRQRAPAAPASTRPRRPRRRRPAPAR